MQAKKIIDNHIVAFIYCFTICLFQALSTIHSIIQNYAKVTCNYMSHKSQIIML
jgi:hypothetical protein